jgi:hypothetical protein
LSNDGKLEKLAFLHHLRPHVESLASLALQGVGDSRQNDSDDEAGSLFELLLVLIGTWSSTQLSQPISDH